MGRVFRVGYFPIVLLRKYGLFFTGFALAGITGSHAGSVEDEIITAFEELRAAVLECDASTMLARLAPEHPLAEEYPHEDALAAGMWINPIPPAERELITALEVTLVERETGSGEVFRLVLKNPEGETFTLFAEKNDGRWVFR